MIPTCAALLDLIQNSDGTCDITLNVTFLRSTFKSNEYYFFIHTVERHALQQIVDKRRKFRND